LLQLRAIQQDGAAEPPNQGDEGQIERGNHDGGVLRFGADGKLYVMVGDLGRRGQLQNLIFGPTDSVLGPTVPDDQFGSGGPQPDDVHFAGVIVRLNDDGSTPTDNPFFAAGTNIGGEVGANIQQIYSYGIRNSFGMDFDPRSGELWTQENGEDAFDEINRVEPGQNSGWIQVIGPLDRIDEFKEIETTSLHHDDIPNLQQLRWMPENIADSPEEALSRLFVLPGSEYSDPEFSWKHVLAPAALGFLNGNGLGREFANDMFVGFSTTDTLGGPLFRFNLTDNRRNIATDDPRLEDLVADNLTFHDMTESESLAIGQDFGILTDIQTGPNGNLYVVSLDQGAVYEIFRVDKENQRAVFGTRLSGDDEVPPRDTRASGNVQLKLSKDGTELEFKVNVNKIENVVAAHLHLGPEGMNGDVVATLYGPVEPGGGRKNGRLVRGTITAEDLEGPLAGQPLSALIDQIRAGMIYVNVHTDDGVGEANTGPGDFADGEIRGQVELRSNSNGDNDDNDDEEGNEDDDSQNDGNQDQRIASGTRLSGDEEVPTRDTNAKGNVQLKLSNDGAALEYKINVARIENVIAAHLHMGAEGINGDVVATLFGPVEPGGGRVHGRLIRGILSTEDLEGPLAGQPLSALIDQIEMGQIYVNVHTDDGVGDANTGPGDFADGELRGQVRLRTNSMVAAVDAVLANWRSNSHWLA
jgi:glucose/arabinose dehydrogenase